MNFRNFKANFKRNVFRLLGNSKGLTLVELLGVLTIMGLLIGIAVPSVQTTIAKAKQDVCYVNASQLENMYETHLLLNDLEHSNELFATFMVENSDGSTEDYQYIDGNVKCSLHPEKDEDEVPSI